MLILHLCSLFQVKAQSPELLGLMADLKSRVSELRDKVAPLRAQVMKVSQMITDYMHCDAIVLHKPSIKYQYYQTSLALRSQYQYTALKLV